MPAHKDLTGTDLHEPKGVAGASIGTVYVASGAGSGSWVKPSAANTTIADTHSRFTATDTEGALNELFEGAICLTGVIADVSTASTILIPVTFDSTLVGIQMVLGGTITSADATVTVTRSDGAAMGSQTITASGSTEGTTFAFAPTGNESLTFASHKYIKLVTDGGSTGTVPLYILAYFQRD